MGCLVETKHEAKIAWLGIVPPDVTGVRSGQADEVVAGFEGIEGELHSGTTRASCVRVTMLHPKGTEIRNTRQLSILSAEENAQIAAEIGVEALNPEWLGASIVVEGIPDWTHVPPGSRLQTPNGTTITIDLENAPCHFPGKEIEADRPGHGKAFKAAAKDRRGVTAWVERPGPLSVGDQVRLFVPTQRAWAPA
ncbi:MOSC domain protein [Candidatus Rhodobacter oscarellae]|uniref:MOSC domain protein n=1 Tax=Candidatus Rhodobacter oscarellae TaxID=1675527 RepID=A0A0J9H163_9RHOB|nr:MOSC domain-containing protein [Candidatus Rhodobacter lobularis]KMW59483.1 MOSC domain protein [Candidatus Rhodobacter lobularis]